MSIYCFFSISLILYLKRILNRINYENCISPAKSLNFEKELPTSKYTEPAFLKESRQIKKSVSSPQKTYLN
jgi:hypothetical protein